MDAMNISHEIISLIDEIRNDKAHGASQLARQAVIILKVAAEHSQVESVNEFLIEQKEVTDRLMLARPAMAPLFNIVNRLFKIISEKAVGVDLNSIRRLTIDKADEVIKESSQAVAQTAKYGSELIAGGDTIMAYSYSSTVVAALKIAFTKHRSIGVITIRSGPGRSGEITARELGLYGVPVTFIDDAAIGLYISMVNKVTVGADRICADGKVVNGIGTYQLALAAEGNGIPFYVLCETLKFDPRWGSDEVDLEEKETWGVVGPEKLPPEVKVKNPSFDITPLELITGIVTEDGLLTPEQVISYIQKQSVNRS